MDETPPCHGTPSRRRFLARSLAVGGVAIGLAGCTGATGSAGSDDGAGGEATGATSDSDAAAPTSTPTPDRLHLETLSVGGSPGGPVVVESPGEPVLLDFFATWCAPCKPQMAELRTVHESLPDLHMLSLTREDDTEAIASFWREYEGTWPVARDTRLEAFREYGVRRIPTLLVLDGSGREVWRHSGLAAAEDVVERVEAAGE
jgi:thiol-disulfide isomerase/thioredoxin